MISLREFALLWCVLLPIIAAVGWGSASVGHAVLLTFAGAFVWSLTEYGLHRFIFHLEPSSDLMKRVIFVIHGNHHSVPSDPLRNLMPPIVSIPVGVAIWLIAVWVGGEAGTWFLLGFMSSYVVYDLIHYACHQRPLKGPFLRILMAHHMRHHNKRHEAGNYAITWIVWDRIFSTDLK